MTQATPIRRSPRRLRPALLAPVVALLLLFGAGSASAGDDDLFQLLPSSFRYPESVDSKPPSFSFRRNESRAVEAPTRYRTHSILRYSTPLGRTGLVLRLKAPLKPRKLVKVEIRF